MFRTNNPTMWVLSLIEVVQVGNIYWWACFRSSYCDSCIGGSSRWGRCWALNTIFSNSLSSVAEQIFHGVGAVTGRVQVSLSVWVTLQVSLCICSCCVTTAPCRRCIHQLDEYDSVCEGALKRVFKNYTTQLDGDVNRACLSALKSSTRCMM